MHKLVLDGISDNMASISQLGKYGYINAEDTTTIRYYAIKYLSEQCTLQEDQTTYGQVSNAGKLLVKSEYLSLMKSKTNWYWKEHGTNQSVIISTRTIVSPCLEVSFIKNSAYITSIIRNKNNHYRMYRGNQFVFMMQIMIIF